MTQPQRGKITMDMSAIVIAVSLVILIILFGVYLKNSTEMQSVSDRKCEIRQGVHTICQILEHFPFTVDTTDSPNIKMNSENHPQLISLLDIIEKTKLLPPSSTSTATNDTKDTSSYIFILDRNGREIVNGGDPKLSHDTIGNRPGPSTIGTQDKTTERLLDKAMKGGGFVEYKWMNPKTGNIQKKIAYVESVPTTSWIAAITDEYAEKILIRLKVMALVQGGQRLSMRNSQMIILEPGYITAYDRWKMGETRWTNLEALKHVFKEALRILEFYKNQNANSSSSSSSGDPNILDTIELNEISTVYDQSIPNHVEDALRGIKNMKNTYKNDRQWCSSVDILIERVTFELQKLSK